MENNNVNKYVSVLNRHSGAVGYYLSETNTRRVFARGESKKIALEELEKLSWADGGDFILKNYLVINDMDALSYLNMEDAEPEYFYTEADIKKLLLEGTLDQLDDTLTFGPAGVQELVKNIAVSIQLPDTRKRKLILDKTGFNIDTAVHINEMMEAPAATPDAAAPERKATPITTAAPQRKSASQFKKVSPSE